PPPSATRPRLRMREGSIESTPRGQTADLNFNAPAELQRRNREGLTADEPKATPRDDEARLVGPREPFRFRSTDQATLLRGRFARARAETRRRRARLQARVGD